jgi:hypothetical protein
MAEKKTRATREESLNAKIRKNAEAIAAQEAKLAALKKIDEDLKKKLNDLNDVKKKAERAAVAKAKRDARKKEEKELLKAIGKSGLSMEEVKEKLGI